MTLVLFYSFVSLLVACILLSAFLSDRSTPKADRLSWLVLLVASLSWPIAIPLSIVERLLKFNPHYLAKQITRKPTLRRSVISKPSI